MRRLGNLANSDGFEELVKKVYSQVDKSKMIKVYIRKSNPNLTNLNYLQQQENLAERIISAEINSEKIQVIEIDKGKSGSLSRKHRAGLQTLFDDVSADKVSVLVILDVSRIFRDITLQAPTEFAALCQRKGIHILTKINNMWVDLDMRDESNRAKFIRLCEDAGNERIKIRERTVASRENSVAEGGWSGSPLPLGYAVTPKLSKFESETGEEEKSQMYIYEPHAAIVRQIVEISMREEIRSLRLLRRFLVQHNITVPPFSQDIVNYNFSRSILCRVIVDARPLRKDEAYIPSVTTLRKIITNPKNSGIVLYGTGWESGKYKKKFLERLYASQNQVSDSLIRDHQVFVRQDDELAIFSTKEERDLWLAAQKKWNVLDVEKMIEGNWESVSENTESVRKRGRPRGTFTKNSGLWAEKVFCYKHGYDEQGTYFTHRTMRLMLNMWACLKDYDEKTNENACAYLVENNKLQRVLDQHLLNTLARIINTDDSILSDYENDKEEHERKVKSLELEISTLEKDYEKAIKGLSRLQMSLDEDDDEEAIQAIVKDYQRVNIVPLKAVIQNNKKELAELSAQFIDTDNRSKEEVKQDIERSILEGKISDDVRRKLIKQFVKNVGVIIPDANLTGAVIIYFQWTDAIRSVNNQGEVENQTDILVTWKNMTRDNREFTEAEDQAIRDFFPRIEDSRYEDLLAQLQEGRKFDSIYNRVFHDLKIKRPFITESWQKECRLKDKTYQQRNPEILYIQLDEVEDHRHLLGMLENDNLTYCTAYKEEPKARIAKTLEELYEIDQRGFDEQIRQELLKLKKYMYTCPLNNFSDTQGGTGQILKNAKSTAMQSTARRHLLLSRTTIRAATRRQAPKTNRSPNAFTKPDRFWASSFWITSSWATIVL